MNKKLKQIFPEILVQLTNTNHTFLNFANTTTRISTEWEYCGLSSVWKDAKLAPAWVVQGLGDSGCTKACVILSG